MVDDLNETEAAPGELERFEKLGRGCYVYSADGCSNTGVVIGDRGVLIVDAQATPALAEKVLHKLREITDLPVRHVVLTHFHAENSLGARAFDPGEIIASDLTRRMIETRGEEEIRVARERFPSLFDELPVNAVAGEPTITIASSMTIDLGGIEIRLMHLGRGHTMGDLVVWVPDSSVIFAGDLVQKAAIPYCGDAHLTDWPRALDRIGAFRPNALVPGRGPSANGEPSVVAAIETTRDFVTTLRDAAAACVEQSLSLKDTFDAVSDALQAQFSGKSDFERHMPFNVARAYDEALGLDQPQIWTRQRCSDLQDALAGVIKTDQPQDQSVPQGESADANAPALEAEEENNPAAETANAEMELVSDSDFAASLVSSADDEDPAVGEAPAQSEDGSGEETDGAEAVSQEDSELPEETEKVLEEAK